MNFIVLDTVVGENTTHAVLDQIIVAQEAAQNKPLLASEFIATWIKVRQRMNRYGKFRF